MATTGFPIDVVFKGKIKTMIWIEGDGDSIKDHILSDEDGIIIFPLVPDGELPRRGPLDLHVNWDSRTKIDLDRFFLSVQNLNWQVTSSAKTRKVLLEGWNFLEDLARSLDIDESIAIFKSQILSKMYNKLFFGNNLPSVTPDGKSYTPMWTFDEVDQLKSAIAQLKSLILEKAPYLLN